MSSFAAKRRARQAKRAGRKAKEGERHECGKLVQPPKQETQKQRMATVVAQRVKHLGVSDEVAKQQSSGNAIEYLGQMKLIDGGLNKNQVHAAERIEEAKAAYDAAILLPRQRSSSDYDGPRGAGSSVITDEYEKQAKRSIETWAMMRRAILESGPLGMMAVEAIIFENKLAYKLLGDLRLALNQVHHAFNAPAPRRFSEMA
ncbi:hypothetical protein FPY71_07165 [Aureimonas fodinaquatilis]|uniref:Uncharacterized protein n=1 Tax=Aureimonas fodinaquatilis TaxID=2565783 RepID=A0A5B0DU15_9HYPH|nr:hypothetical protein [Aureimonas fodinaquatilis]KAA0970297.1 hypothetical protein FPY71_07165 [Aureimonas fodinaquatilis]